MTFTAAQIAHALGRARQSVQHALADVPPSAFDTISGNRAAAWEFCVLPAALQTDLEAAAQARGFVDAHALLSRPPDRWQPAYQPGPDDWQRAEKLRAVFQPFLLVQDADHRAQAQLEADGIAAYQIVFGETPSGRWFRELLTRFNERDAGANDFDRLELYVGERPIRGPRLPVRQAGPNFNHASLADRLTFKDPAKPTLTERQNAFEYSFRHFENLAAGTPGQSAEIKQSVLRFLCATAPIIAACKEALIRNWHRKYDRWKRHGQTPAAVADLRPVNSGSFCLVDLEADLQLIVESAYHLDGKLAIAIRKLRREGKLSPAFTDRYTLDVRRNKSYVAKSVRQEITARLTGLLEHRRSQWAVQRAGPSIDRIHDYAPGDFFAADDVRFNITWWFIDEHGQPDVTNGEVLMFFDCRSLYPLGYIMVAGAYNGETIRRGILHVHDRHGLPRRGFVFERGAWESRLITNGVSRDFLGWSEYEMGFRNNGISMEPPELRTCHTPGAKLIEGAFNILQQNQRSEKGFVGFQEREYGQARLQKAKARVRRGLLDPSKEFYSGQEWRDAIDRSLEVYMNEPQNGKLLPGLSPAEMFARHRPLRQFSPEQRFLIASHRVKTRIRPRGLCIKIRGHSVKVAIANGELAQFIGREVFAFYNIEQPNLITVSDLAMKTFISVKRKQISAFAATPEQLADVHQDRARFMRPAKLRVQEFKDNLKHSVRRSVVDDNLVDQDFQAIGRHIRQQTEQHEAEQDAETKEVSRLARVAEASGVQPPASAFTSPRAREGWLEEMALRTERNAAAIESAEIAAPASAGADDGKIYTLNTAPAPAPSARAFWSLWAQVEKARPGLNRHALTQKAIGCHPLPKDMTPEQLEKMIDVFAAILRQEKAVKI